VVFDVGMAARYGHGRRLRAADVDAWMDAARPYLRGLVLDLGAGTGRFTRALGANVVACEPSAAMRAVCRAECPGNPVVGGAAEAAPFRDGAFDAIWASQMVHHVTDLGAFAANVRRMLKPGGHLLLRGGFGPPDDLPYYRYFPAAWSDRTAMATLLTELTGALAAAGLPRVARRKVGQVLAESPRDFVERARSRSLSNLATLDDALFRSGVEAMERDAGEGRLPERITEHLDLIVFGGRV
jgi:SAM-dependent methyltransferase